MLPLMSHGECVPRGQPDRRMDASRHLTLSDMDAASIEASLSRRDRVAHVIPADENG